MGTEDSSLTRGIIDFDYVAEKDARRKLFEHEYLGTPIHPEDWIDGIIDPNAKLSMCTISPRGMSKGYYYTYSTPEDVTMICRSIFPLIHPYDYINPELRKVLYPLPNKLQKKVDDFMDYMDRLDPRSLSWNQIGTSQKKQLPKSKRQLKRNEKSAKNPEEPGSENTLGIQRIKLSPSILA